MNLIDNGKGRVNNITHTHRDYGFEAKVQLWKKDKNDSFVIFSQCYILNPQEKMTIRAIPICLKLSFTVILKYLIWKNTEKHLCFHEEF